MEKCNKKINCARFPRFCARTRAIPGTLPSVEAPSVKKRRKNRKGRRKKNGEKGEKTSSRLPKGASFRKFFFDGITLSRNFCNCFLCSAGFFRTLIVFHIHFNPPSADLSIIACKKILRNIENG